MRRAFLSALACASLSCISTLLAQPYPTRAVTLIVPFGAGGPLDTLTRIVSERMRVSLGQPILIDNITGASGVIGVGRAVRADPDGYTVSVGNWQLTSSMARFLLCSTICCATWSRSLCCQATPI